MKLARMLLLGTTALAVCVPVAALAQSTDTPPPANKQADPSASQDSTSQDIVVTGDRNNQYGTDVVQSGSFRNAKVLDVPLTISVIPRAVLESQQAIELYDAVRNTAGVSNTGTGTVAYQNITIRGIAVDTRANFRIDGALNTLSATAIPLEDKDRVEVLKGASALYYGFSTPAGIVNFTMKRPTPELSFFENTFGDNHGSIGEHVDIGDTIGIFGFRVNGVAEHMDTGIKDAEGERYLASGAFDFKPTDRLTITVDTEYFQKAIAEPPYIILPVSATSTAPVTIPNASALNPKTNFSGADWDINRTYEYNLLGKAVYKINNDWNISGYYGRSHMIRYRNNPQITLNNLTTAIDPASPGFGLGTLAFSGQKAHFTNINYAIEAAGTIHFGKVRNEVLIGASRIIRLNSSSANVRTTFKNQSLTNPYYIPNPNIPYTALPLPPTITDDKGAYIFDRLSFNDVVQLIGGVRASDYYDQGSINTVTKSPYEVKPISFSGGGIIKPVKWASIYGTYIEGLEETAAAPSQDDNATETFDPTFSHQVEAGLKLEPKPNLLFQFAYFNINRGAAYSAPEPGTNILHYYVDGRQTYSGLEASGSGYVIPDLAINATLMLLTARYEDQPTIAGNFVDGAPKNSYSLSGEYRLSWLTPALKLTAGMYHTGPQPIDATNRAWTRPYTTFDLGGSYTFKMNEHEMILRVTAQNFTGVRYWASVGGDVLAPAVPETVKFSLSFKY